MELIGITGIIISLWMMHRETFKKMKDFHERLCSLEEKYIKMTHRYMENKK